MEIEAIIDQKLKHARSISNEKPQESMNECTEALAMAEEAGLCEKIGDSYIGMAYVARTKSDKSNLLNYSFQALNKYEKIKSTIGIGKSFNLIGVAYFYSGMYEEALRYFLDALNKIKNINNPELLASVNNNIGEVYRESALCDKANEYYEKAYKISLENNLDYYQATILGNIGEIYLMQGDTNIAQDYLKRAFIILKEGNDCVSMGEVSNKIGKSLMMQGKIESAVDYYKKALQILDKIDNQFYKIEVLSNLAETKSDPEESIALLKDAIALALEVGAKKKLSNLYRLVSLSYENIMDFRTALSYYKKYFLINREVLNSNIRNRLEILNVEIEQLEENQQFDKMKSTLEKELEDNRIELEEVKRNNIILEKEAFEDELTKIPNRRSVNIQLKNLLLNCKGKNHRLAVYMLDIDKFKDYNDYWGHSKGDNCLILIAERLQSIAGKRGDMVGRYGGEEFVYISKTSSYEEAIRLGEIILKNISSMGLQYDNTGEKGPVTISIGGICGKTVDFKDFSQIMELADKELYKAKVGGRNLSEVIQI